MDAQGRAWYLFCAGDGVLEVVGVAVFSAMIALIIIGGLVGYQRLLINK